MFNKSKYSTWYYRIVENAKNRICISDQYYEKHHIIPKCLGGSNDKENLVHLTAREHFICHILLIKMVDENVRGKMGYALFRMKTLSKWHSGRKINSEDFSYVRKIMTKATSGKNNGFYGKGYLQSGNKNPFYGKKHSEDSKQRMSISQSGKFGDKNSFYGKKHSEETRKRLSKIRSKPIKVIFFDGREFELSNRLELGKILGKSSHLGAKLLKPNYKHLWKNYNIKDIILL